MYSNKKTPSTKLSSSAIASNAENALPRGMVPAVVKAVRVLDSLAGSREPLALSSLAKKLALPKSTIYTLCATLVQVGLVHRYESGTYHLGVHVMDLSYAFLSRTDAISEFYKLLSADFLPDETMIFSILDGADVVYLACRNGGRSLGLSFRVGLRLPATTTATGKAQLSTLPEERVIELMRAGGFHRLTKRSISSLPALLNELAKVRRRGYSVDDEETGDGSMCYGAPVFGPGSEQAVAGVAVSFLKAAVSGRRRVTYRQAIRDLAATLSNRLGAR